jgi:4-amino-4-deoxy-L-arabinose transferase-like glycosyltransferase
MMQRTLSVPAQRTSLRQRALNPLVPMNVTPGALVAIAAALQAVVWTVTPALINFAPPLDVVESYMWGREWVLATYKHPAMPSWVLEASRVLAGGAFGWPAYLASQLFIAATFAFIFVFGRDIMGSRRAAAGVLLLAALPAYTWLSPEFNHNIAMLPFWAGVVMALWRAVERSSTPWWMAVGAFAAAGLYAKFTTATLLLAAGGWILWDEKARRSLATPGPWLGLAVFVAISAPLAIWLIEHRYAPLAYVSERAKLGRDPHLQPFLWGSLANFLAVVVGLWVAGLLKRKESTVGSSSTTVNPRSLRFMGVLLFGPLLLTLVVASATGSGLRSAWSNSMFNLAGIFAVGLLSERVDETALKRLMRFVVALVVLFPLGYAVVFGPFFYTPSKLPRVQWPQAEITDRFQSLWSTATGGLPLRIVTGRNWPAGLVGLTAPARPSILNSGRLDWSPWVSQARIDREGMLIVWDGPESKLPPALAPYRDRQPAGTERFKVPGKSSEIDIHWIVVPPKSGS